jgi:hypothetical protein
VLDMTCSLSPRATNRRKTEYHYDTRGACTINN